MPTRHPASGMTKAQIHAFELIAINEHPRCGETTIARLLERGIIVEDKPKQIGCDSFGPVTVRQWHVPLQIHMQWCKWCDEQPDIQV